MFFCVWFNISLLSLFNLGYIVRYYQKFFFVMSSHLKENINVIISFDSFKSKQQF